VPWIGIRDARAHHGGTILETAQTVRDGETKEVPRVQWINRLGSVNLENAMGAAEAQAFGARMKGLVLAMKQKKPQPAADPASFPFGANAPARAAGSAPRRAF
jgi:hypothetical protein